MHRGSEAAAAQLGCWAGPLAGRRPHLVHALLEPHGAGLRCRALLPRTSRSRTRRGLTGWLAAPAGTPRRPLNKQGRGQWRRPALRPRQPGGRRESGRVLRRNGKPLCVGPLATAQAGPGQQGSRGVAGWTGCEGPAAGRLRARRAPGLRARRAPGLPRGPPADELIVVCRTPAQQASLRLLPGTSSASCLLESGLSWPCALPSRQM